ncbi:MAG: VOC family protein [Pseudomonadota bacterium]
MPPAITTPHILETALYAEDLDAAAGFYGGVMGLPQVSRHPTRHVFFRVAGAMLLVFRPEETSKGQPPHLTHGATGQGHVCFAASDAQIDAWRGVFEAKGIAIEADLHWPNGARSLYVRDPAGNSVEFAEPHLWAP